MSMKPTHSVATTVGPDRSCYGRLGNSLSTFASLYSVWREFGIYNFIGSCQQNDLTNAFDLPVRSSKDSNDWPYYIWNKGNLSNENIFIKKY